MHKATNRFWHCFDSLPVSIQETAKKNFEILKENPKHPSLHFKRIGKLWSARVGLSHRALAVQKEQNFIWVWIGKHENYEKLIHD